MSVSYAWIYWIPGVLYLVFFIGALVFLFSKLGRHPRAAWLAIVGIGISLIAHVAQLSSSMIILRLFDSEQFMLYHGTLQVFFSLANITGKGIVVAAVFAYRQPAEPGTERASGFPETSDNPYVPPTNV